ncbi:TPA: hypothetical protein O2A75_002817 [Staphylococcus aureus]|nr:hypothetical protein [Staphylococcus aureus]HCY8634498.1 hypothetical protein [Staphylococcus aureus]
MNKNELEIYKTTIKKTEDFIEYMKKYESMRKNSYLYHSLNELLLILELVVSNLKNKVK